MLTFLGIKEYLYASIVAFALDPKANGKIVVVHLNCWKWPSDFQLASFAITVKVGR